MVENRDLDIGTAPCTYNTRTKIFLWIIYWLILWTASVIFCVFV